MARTKCERNIEGKPKAGYFKPAGIPMTELESVSISLDEFEAIRLADLNGEYQEQAAQKMGISRPTFGRIIADAHHKIAEALILGKAIIIEQNQ